VPLLLFASAEAKTSLFLAGAHCAPVAAFCQSAQQFLPTKFAGRLYVAQIRSPLFWAGGLILHSSYIPIVGIYRSMDWQSRGCDQWVLDAEAKTSLERTIDRNTSLPGVSGTHLLTGGDYGPPASRRLTYLTDGSTLVEEVPENVRDKNSAQFRYVVWNYTSEKARPIVYGVGYFVRTDLGSSRTRVQWTYSFQLNRRPLPRLSGANRRFPVSRRFP
jgi:hypothetical protein